MEDHEDGKPCFCSHGNAMKHEHQWEEIGRKEVFDGTTKEQLMAGAIFGVVAIGILAGMCFSVLEAHWAIGVFGAGAFSLGLFCMGLNLRCCGRAVQCLKVTKTMRCPLCKLASEEEEKYEWRCNCCGKQLT